MNDPIVDEVRRIRDAHAAKLGYDPDAIFRDIKEKEKNSGRKYVSFADERSSPDTPLPSIGTAISASSSPRTPEAVSAD